VSIASLKAGYTTFCEKPMAMNVRQCAAMIDAAKAAGKGLMIGQVLRYIDAYRYVLELATSGELGKAFAMRTTRTQGRWGNPWIQPWRLSYELCGGMLPEVNVHEIDLMLCILGDAVSVSAVGGHYANDQFDYEDVMTGHITFANGGVGNVTSICCDWLGRHSAEIYLEKGTIYYDSLVNEVHVGKLGEEKRVLKYGQINPEWENGVYREMREFIEACLGERDVTIPGEQGIRGVEIAEAMYLSAREKRPVALPLPRR
jgi:predicted dehydrogenase